MWGMKAFLAILVGVGSIYFVTRVFVSPEEFDNYIFKALVMQGFLLLSLAIRENGLNER